ncbi:MULTISPECIES: GGDEF domain-containing protein [Exiguobacterium]|uniref:GGDEF domain-containing protein n=1 Tax=Exiguobacterium TaxID=33986 RepID=UPI001BE58D84|nr:MULTISPECIES: diguanylate cyclase [Exiguobacterium]MCT4776805.1 diguanylate cyclase [Exiguobacterium aquaticum]MCT4790274.1 diguanylate cyclase [Exiguobacterium mexicanum]
MKLWNNESFYLFGLIACMMIGTMAFTILLSESNTGLLGYLILPAIVLSSLIFGMRAGLTLSVTLLLFLFIYFRWFASIYEAGNVQFFNGRGISFTILLMVMSVLSGLVHQLVKNVQLSQLELEERARQLVAVDPETWLDNAERFQMDLNAERDRLIRHGDAFAVSFIQIQELRHFEERYGRTEYEWFLNYFSDELHLATRRTDHKYRIALDTFAIIYPYTSPEAVRVVHDRIHPLLEQYELQNGEHVSLMFEDTFYDVNRENGNAVVDEIIANMSAFS